MTIGFYYAGGKADQALYADLLVRSARRCMPVVPIVQFSDPRTAQVAGTDQIIRRPSQPLALAIAEHYAGCHGPWLFLDSDVVVQTDVRAVFQQSFDVAVARRHPEETRWSIHETMPHNTGVVFSRSPAFWHEVAAAVRAMSPRDQAWYGMQRATNDSIRAGGWSVRVLVGAYNFTPRTADEDVSDQALVHYKGPTRKPWLRERFLREAVCA